MFVIAGVTGNTGSVAAQTLLDQGKDVRVIVRNAEKGKIWKDKGAEVAIADLFDVSALTQALIGAENAYLLLPPEMTSDDFVDSRKKMADGFMQAIEASKIERVTVLSSVGAQHNDKTGPILTLSYLERLLEKSTVKSTAIRPGYFIENWADIVPAVVNEGILPSFIHPLDLKIDMVATQDIAQTVVNALLHPGDDAHRVIQVKGAAQYSSHDVAQAFSKILDKDVTPIAVPRETWQETLTQSGISQTSAALFSEMFDAINSSYIQYTDAPTQTGETKLETIIQKLVA